MLARHVFVLACILVGSDAAMARALAGGEVEERLREKPNITFESEKSPIELELCVADALTQRGVFPAVYRMPEGGLFFTIYRSTVIITPTDTGSRLALSTRGNNDERIGRQLVKCL
jgi:hypothetical protein